MYQSPMYTDDAPSNNVESLRVAPQAIDAEQDVLGALMNDPNALGVIAAIVSEHDFYRRDHQRIFKAICDLADDKLPFDAVTVAEWFASRGESDLVAGGNYLVQLSAGADFAANVETHARIVRDKALLRQMIDLGTDIANAGYLTGGANAPLLLAQAVERVLGLQSKTAHDYAEPMDIYGELYKPELQPDWLPPIIAKFAFDAAKQKGTAAEIIAMTALVTAAGATHDGFVLQPKPNEPRWQESARLWLMVVANPGSKKSAAMKAAIGPLKEINDGLMQRSIAEMARYEDEMKVAALVQKATVKRRAKEAMGEAVGYEGDDAQDTGPQRPKNERIIVSDATIEKIGEICCDNPRGLMMFRDELTGWFGGMDAYSNRGVAKDRPKWLEAYEGGRTAIDRITRGTLVVDNWSLSVAGSIQPDKIRAIMANSDGDDGLFQRFMIVEIPDGYREQSMEAADDAAYHRYAEAIRALWSRVPVGGHCPIRLDADAQKLCDEFIQWSDRVASSPGLSPMLRGHLGKWTGLWSRLVVTYHCFGCAAAGKWPGSTPVTVSTVHRVTSLMKRFLLPQAQKLYGDVQGEQEGPYKLARAIGDYLLAHGCSRVSGRDLTQRVGAWRIAKDWERRSAIVALLEASWLVGEAGTYNKGSDIGHAWAVNPRIHTLHAGRAASERARRGQASGALGELRAAARGD